MIEILNRIVRGYLWASEFSIPELRTKNLKSNMNISLFKCDLKVDYEVSIKDNLNQIAIDSIRNFGVDVNNEKTLRIINETLIQVMSDKVITSMIAQRVKHRLDQH
jgi:hypothetical protein